MNIKEINGLLWSLIDQQKIDSNSSLQESDRIAFFQAVYISFQTAEAVTGSIKRFYDIGGYIVCLRFAGEGLIQKITSAIAHLEVQSVNNPDFTVCLWDSVSTNTKMSFLVNLLTELIQVNWPEFLDTRKEIKEFNSDRILAAYHIGPNILSFFDKQANLAVYWLENANQIPYFEHGSPLQTILNWWTQDHHRQYVHAGAVGTAKGGVLIAGKGGSGKSTSALACLNSELTYASDDYCLIARKPEPYVYSLYNTVKLRGANDFQRFPHLVDLITNPNYSQEEKAMIFLHQHYPDKIVKGFPIKAILAPQIMGGKDTKIKPTTPMNALKALAPSTLFQLSGTGKTALQTMSELVKEVDCYILELGTDISQIPKVILDLLS
ncbi:hypothetical protein [Geminocystis sp. NIES-3709]|uniref:hypothetical protein n=1 Tax=Geminocystis sp. NIES-3709 TaxID=1617448 RepID=UPI0005FC3F4F|nr:hypothetical protein [Geminocystis sp. NIES-3709]BAQ64666.1 hypothetical protein GM3709_1431 [Geminocystis sp. NIES-3709]